MRSADYNEFKENQEPDLDADKEGNLQTEHA